jgi:hypothetical protein
VGVTRQHKADRSAPGMLYDEVGVVRFMRHEDDRSAWLGRDCQIEAWVAGSGIGYAAYPQAISISIQRNVLVHQDRDRIGSKRLDDHGGAYAYVVISQYCEPLLAFETGEDLCAAMGRVAGGDEGERTEGNEISREQDQIGIQTVDLMYDALKEKGLRELVQVDITKLNDSMSMESLRKLPQLDCPPNDVEFMAGDLSSVEREPRGDGTGSDEKAATGKSMSKRCANCGHNP